MRLPLLLVAFAACAPAPTATTPTPTCPTAPPTASAAPPPAAREVATPCRKASEEEARVLRSLVDGKRGPEAGAFRSDHGELVRAFPGLHEGGRFLRSIGATHGDGPHGPIFAVTLLVRGASGDMDASLGFATAPCAGGDLTLASALTPLGARDATIAYTTRVPLASAIVTELQIDAGEPTPLLGGPHATARRSVAVTGTTVLGSLPLDVELEPDGDVRRREMHLLGSGWYTLGPGAVYVLVHHTVHDQADLCRTKRKAPPSPPSLRTLARIDEKGTFSPGMIPVLLAGLATNNPPEGLGTCRPGPTAVASTFYEYGGPGQLLCGAFAGGSVPKGVPIATEPAPGQGPPKFNWTVDVKPAKRGGFMDACDIF